MGKYEIRSKRATDKDVLAARVKVQESRLRDRKRA